MHRYQISYELSTHDDDGPSIQIKRFNAKDDNSAREIGNSIMLNRVQKINGAGSAANARKCEIRRVLETLSDPI